MDQKLTKKRIWSLLHSMTAYYPQEPSQFEKENAYNFLNGFICDFGLTDTEYSIKFSEQFCYHMNSKKSMNYLN